MPKSLLQKWPQLETLHLTCNCIEDMAISDLVRADLSCLKSLALRATNISSDAVSRLWSANWPLLQKLDLSQNCAATSTLSGGQWPQLKCLRLAAVCFTVLDAERLINGKWPQLKVLDLSRSKISEETMKVLIRGAWPVLKRLSFMYSRVESSAVKVLLQTGWASLERLDMPASHASNHRLVLYSMFHGPLLKAGLNWLDARHRHLAFPQLKELNFCDDWQTPADK